MSRSLNKIKVLTTFLGLFLSVQILGFSAKNTEVTATERSLYFYLASQLNMLVLGPTLKTESLLTEAYKEDPSAWYIKYTIAEYHVITGAFIKAKTELEALRKIHAKNIEVRLLLAKVYALLNYYDDSQAVFEEILSLNPQHEESLFHLSLVYASKKKYKKALKLLNQLKGFSERLAMVYLYQARIHLEMSNEDKAIRALRKAIAAKTEHSEVYLLLANLLEVKGNRKEALMYYEEYSQLNPDDQEVLKKLVDEYITVNNYDKAMPLLHELYRLDPSNHKISLKIALIDVEYGRLGEARELLKSILDQTPELDIAHYYLGMVCQMQEDTSCSQKAYGGVSQESPFYSESVLQRAFMFIGLRQYDKAIKELNQSRKKGVMDENIALVASAAYELKGDLKPATKVLDDYLKIEKKNTRVLYAKANLLYKRNKHEPAIDVIQTLLNLDPNHVQGLNFLGYHLLTVGVTPEKAYAPLKKAIDLAPSDPYILDSWGWYWFVMNDLEKASHHLESAFLRKQDDVTILEHLVLTLIKKGDTQKAQSFLDMSKVHYNLYTSDEKDKFDALASNVDQERRLRGLASE